MVLGYEFHQRGDDGMTKYAGKVFLFMAIAAVMYVVGLRIGFKAGISFLGTSANFEIG
jgi:hypothetical protein